MFLFSACLNTGFLGLKACENNSDNIYVLSVCLNPISYSLGRLEGCPKCDLNYSGSDMNPGTIACFYLEPLNQSKIPGCE